MEHLIGIILWVVLLAEPNFTRDQEKIIVISALSGVVCILFGYLIALVNKLFGFAKDLHGAYLSNTEVVSQNTAALNSMREYNASALNSLKEYMRETLPDKIAEKIKAARR